MINSICVFCSLFSLMGALCSSPQPQSAGESATPPAVQIQPGETLSTAAAPAPAPASASASASTAASTPSSSHTATIYVVYYSMYGHIAQLAEEVARGAKEAGADVKIFRFAETLSQDILDLMHAPPKNESHPVITPDELKHADGIIFGIPTRFGQGAAQTKAFWDSTGQLWQAGALAGKTAGVFVSTATQGGGQETTAFTQLTHFVHHGMLYIPIGYTSPLLFNMDEVHGGSPYGAGTLAGPTGARQPSKLERDVAFHQGKHQATITIALKAGREAAAK